MSNQDRIRLAELQGWVRRENFPDKQAVFSVDQLPNPFEDANDCGMLIQSMNDAGWFFHRQDEGGRSGADLIRPVQTLIRFHRHRPYKNFEWRGKDWKHGVCDLALKVLGDGDD